MVSACSRRSPFEFAVRSVSEPRHSATRLFRADGRQAAALLMSLSHSGIQLASWKTQAGCATCLSAHLRKSAVLEQLNYENQPLHNTRWQLAVGGEYSQVIQISATSLVATRHSPTRTPTLLACSTQDALRPSQNVQAPSSLERDRCR